MFISSKRILMGIFAFCAMLSSVAAAPKAKNDTSEGWKTFQSKDSGFSVMLPKPPQHVQQTIKIPQTDLSIKYDTYVSEPDPSAVYVISVWNYPSEIDMSKPEVNLQDGFGGMLSALPGSQVISMNVTEIQGFKALEFMVKNADIYFQGKLILVHNTLYQVFTVYKENADMKSDYTRFINSFKLIDPASRKISPKNSKAMNL